MKKAFFRLCILTFFLNNINLFSQNVTILPSGITPNVNGVQKTTTNIRMSLSFQNVQEAGNLVFDLTNGQLYVWEGNKWKKIITEGNDVLYDPIPTIERFDGDEIETDGFGSSVAISGNWAIVGSPNHGSKGEAYIFKMTENSWQLSIKLCSDLINTQIENNAEFGFDVDIKAIGNEVVALVGAPEQNGTGKAYIFRYKTINKVSNWFYEPASGNLPLAHPIPTNNGAGGSDRFGHSVALEDGYIAIGAPHDYITVASTLYQNAGSVTIFKMSTFGNSISWIAMGGGSNGTIWSEDISAYAKFGWDIDITKNIFYNSAKMQEFEIVVLIGAPKFQTVSNASKGRADLYKLTTALINNTPIWQRLKSFTLASLNNDFIFQYGFSEGLTGLNYQIGTKVALLENTLAFGAPLDSEIPLDQNKGTVVVFRTNGGWFNVNTGQTKGVLFIGDDYGSNIGISSNSVIFSKAGVTDSFKSADVYELSLNNSSIETVDILKLQHIEFENTFNMLDICGDINGNFIVGLKRNSYNKNRSIFLGSVNSN